MNVAENFKTLWEESQKADPYFSGDKIVKAFLKRYSELSPNTKVDIDSGTLKRLSKYITHYSIQHESIFRTRNFIHVSDQNSDNRWIASTNGYDMIRIPTSLHTGTYYISEGNLLRNTDALSKSERL